VDFESARDVVAAITPVPGGVGPLTNALLLSHLLRAATDQAEMVARAGGTPGPKAAAAGDPAR